MRVWLPLYARRIGGLHELFTLGLGALSSRGRGRHPARVKRHIADDLQKSLRSQPAPVMKLFERRPGMKLVRVRLELKLGRGRRTTGLFPFVVERVATVDERLIAYHPLRQQQVLLTTLGTLREDAGRHFSALWRELTDEALAALETDGKDRLEAFATTLHPTDLLDTLPQRERSVFEDLEPEDRQRGASEPRVPRRGVPAILRDLGEDWTPAAADGALHLGRPRDRWRERLAQLLCVDRPRSLVLVGPPGAGKRTLLRRAADDLLHHDGFGTHRNLDEVRHVIELAGSRLIAGMSYVGDWEKRCQEVLDAARGGRFLLLFQDLHTLGRVGQSRDSARSVADFFRGPLQRGEVVMLGTATDSQWKRLEEDAPAFAGAFAALPIEPSSRRETMQMMLHEVARIEREAPVAYTPELLFDVIDLGAPLLQGALPGTAVDLVTELVKGLRGEGTRIELDSSMLLDTLETRTGLAADLIEPDATLSRAEVVEFLETRVMGQRAAVEAATDLVLRIRAAMTDPDRPLGTYLFTGPTGTGKTELAKALTEFLFPDDPDRLVRFDMGEFSGPDAPARLAGDRFEPRGLLTEAVRRRPFCVILLDEIEKAHRSVLHLLLQILEDGRLTDAAGDRADFRHAVVVLTSNLGARARPSVGFGDSDRAAALDVSRAVRDFFPPELFNRIDRVVPFSPLSEVAAQQIAVKELAKLLGRRGLTERNVFVSTAQSAAQRMAADAFDSSAGARSVRRYLEHTIAPVLADHLASTVRPELELVRIRHDGAAYVLDSEPLVEAEPRRGRSALEDLVDARAIEVALALPTALEWLDEVERSGELDSLSRRISSHLSRFESGGRPSDADAIVHLDQLRDELGRFREHVEAFVHYEERRREAQHILEADRRRRRHPRREGDAQRSPRSHLLHPRWMLPPMPRQDAREMLAALAEVSFLRRLLAAPLSSPWRITLHLQVLGDARATFVGLSQALREHYVGQRGELESVAFVGPSGVLDGELDSFANVAREVAVTLVGLGLDSLWADEDGCHVWTTSHGRSEVVRVRVVPDATARQVLEEAVAARDGGESRAMDEGLGAAVRRLHYDGLHPSTVSMPLTIEDYRLGHVFSRTTRDVQEGLDVLLWLRMAWEEPGGEAPGAERSGPRDR